MLLYLLFAAVIVLYILHVIFNCTEEMMLIRNMPRPKEVFLLGNALDIFVSPVELFRVARNYAKTFNGIYSWSTLRIKAVNIYNPDDIETVISSTKHNGKNVVYTFLKSWLKEGLLLSNGPKWHQRRKILTPAFHFNILRQFCATLEENSQRLVDALGRTEGAPVDIVPVLSEYTLNSICETAMGARLHDEPSGARKSYKQGISELGNLAVERISNVLPVIPDLTLERETMNAARSYKSAIYEMGQLIVDRFSRIYLIPEFIFNLSVTGRKTKKQLEGVHSFTKRVIKERKLYVEQHGIKFSEEAAEHDDVYLSSRKKKIAMLDLLISAEREGNIDSAGIQEEVDTFMFEGHDSTSSGLTYCLMLLANNKHIQDKIVAELQEIFGDSTRLATIQDLSMMRYLECCIKESMRLYPPVPFIGRTLTEPVKLSNYTVPAGTYINIHIYDLHRSEVLFKNPLVFYPDRFLAENSSGRHPYAYIPFSAGPRNCIGQKFAMVEMKSCVAAIVRKFELQPITKPDDVEFKADLVLRGTKPVFVKFVPRNKTCGSAQS